MPIATAQPENVRAAEAAENSDAFDRLSFENALIGRLQFAHEVRRDLLANEILAANRSRHNGVAAVHDYGDPVGRHLLAAQNFAQSFRENAEGQRVARLAVRQYWGLDDDDGLLPDRAYEQVRNDRLSCRDDTPQLLALMKRKLFTEGPQGIDELLPAHVAEDDVVDVEDLHQYAVHRHKNS